MWAECWACCLHVQLSLVQSTTGKSQLQPPTAAWPHTVPPPAHPPLAARAGRSPPSRTSSLKTRRPTSTPSGYTAPAPACSDSAAGRGGRSSRPAAGSQRPAAGALHAATERALHAAAAKYRNPLPSCSRLPALMPSAVCGSAAPCSYQYFQAVNLLFSVPAASRGDGRLACEAEGAERERRAAGAGWTHLPARSRRSGCVLTGSLQLDRHQAGRLSLV